MGTRRLRTEAEKQGYLARFQDVPFGDNPHAEGDDPARCNLWWAGWLEANIAALCMWEPWPTAQ